jgi:hypothetical protein
MAEIETRSDDQTEKTEEMAAFNRADLMCPFGPSFFLGHLGRFVRDHCPDSTERLPEVQVRLTGGEALELCHIIGVSPRWVMLAVHDAASHSGGMAIELVPFERIMGIHIGTPHGEGAVVGFVQNRAPEVMTVETLLRATMSPGHSAAGQDSRSAHTQPAATR